MCAHGSASIHMRVINFHVYARVQNRINVLMKYTLWLSSCRYSLGHYPLPEDQGTILPCDKHSFNGNTI